MAPDGDIAAVVLAAGSSRRFGEENKLLASIDGHTLVARVVGALLDGGVGQLIVVTGWDRVGVERALAGGKPRLAHNAGWDAGMGSSIGVGIAALNPLPAAAFIVPGDMPLLTPAVVAALITAFNDGGRDRVVYPATHAGEQRNPVLWPRRFFADLQKLAPAEGAKPLLMRLPATDRIAIEFGDERAFVDVDTPIELAAARSRGA